MAFYIRQSQDLIDRAKNRVDEKEAWHLEQALEKNDYVDKYNRMVEIQDYILNSVENYNKLL